MSLCNIKTNASLIVNHLGKMISHRILPVYPPNGSSSIADQIRERRGARGLTPLDGTLLRSPSIAGGWNQLLGAVRSKGKLPADIRELMVTTDFISSFFLSVFLFVAI
jgi:hypothetical protein